MRPAARRQRTANGPRTARARQPRPPTQHHVRILNSSRSNGPNWLMLPSAENERRRQLKEGPTRALDTNVCSGGRLNPTVTATLVGTPVAIQGGELLSWPIDMLMAEVTRVAMASQGRKV